MLRSRSLPGVLWAVALTGCGRLGFAGDGPDAANAMLAVPAALQLPDIECGMAPGSAPVAIENPGTEDVTLTGADLSGGFTLAETLPVTIAAGATMQLTVRAPGAVIGTDKNGDTRQGQLALDTTAGTYTIDLAAGVVGANIGVSDGLGMPLTLTFSGTGCPAPITAVIRNIGTRDAFVALSPPSRFRTSGFTSGTIASGASAVLTVRPYTSAACAGSDMISFVVTGDACTASPMVFAASFNLTGSSSCACS